MAKRNTLHPHEQRRAQRSPSTGQTRQTGKPIPSHPKSSGSTTQHQRQQTTPPAPPHHRRRRRVTLGQRLASISGGGWVGIVTGALVLGIVVFAIVNSLAGSASGSSSTIKQLNSTHGLLASGTTSPSIGTLQGADGKTYTLAQYKGKVVVLEFFATWCPHCQAETSVLKQIQQNDGAQGVQVLSVSASDDGRHSESDTQATPITMSDVQWFATNFGLNYPALLDSSLNAANTYGVQGYPTIYVINKQGVITYAGDGQTDYNSLQQQVIQALNS